MILFYAAENTPVVEALEQIVASELPAHPLIRCRTLSFMEQRLRCPRNGIDVILISISDAIEMRLLSAMRLLLIDLRLVMVLPWRDEDIIAWAHKLGPRFIAFADNGYEQVGPVLNKMIGSGNVIDLALHR